MRDFSAVADFSLRNRPKIHVSIVLLSLLMIPGLLQTLTPIDVESYDMDGPEMVAENVIDAEFSSKEVTVGFVVSVRDPYYSENGSQAPHTDGDGNPIVEELPVPQEVVSFQGQGNGLVGEGIPVGGIFNLTVLREIQQKIEIVRNDTLAQFYRPLVSELTEEANGTLSLYELIDAFMGNRSLLTRDTTDPLGNIVFAKTNWTDCGVLECLGFGDPNLTQAHVDMAVNRMIVASPSAFMRWSTNDRAFLYDPESPVIGPYGGVIGESGEFENAAQLPGRWAASGSWILIQVDKEEMRASGYTFVWGEARSEENSMSWNGFDLYITPPDITPQECAESKEAGNGPCSADWALIGLEYSLRATDQHVITKLAPPVGVNAEVNRELQESAILLATMFICVLILLFASLRRVSDVGIVAMTLGFSLLWMQGLIGWGMILGNTFDVKIISRSQFSNLLPILILALGIDDSLHALHRYKEERKQGKDPEESVRISLSRVGRAIMLTSMTTMAAFAANFTSSIPALRSFGLEAALGVASAFLLTGIWAPLIRYDIDNWLEKRGRLIDESEKRIYLVPEHWLSRISGYSAWAAPLIMIVTLVLTAIATPVMLSLEGDFKVEDFIEEDSEMNQVVLIINERFSSEGEPALILVEGDILNPAVYDAIGELRVNMNNISSEDPQRYTTLPTGQVELHAIDELVGLWAVGSLLSNSTPFEVAGWNSSAPGNGVGCNSVNGIPDISSRGCLRFFFGFVSVYGIPAAGVIPEIPPSIPALYISPECEINPIATFLCLDGSNPRYERMTMRWGIVRPEQFEFTEQVLEEMDRDLSGFANLSLTDMSERSESSSETEEYPVTWVITTGSPVTRYVAASSMQNELQGTLVLGVYFCLITLWWGFRPEVNQSKFALRRGKEELALLSAWGLLAGFAIGGVMMQIYGVNVGVLCGLIVFILNFLWGERSLALALITTIPILTVVVWLYGMIAFAGYGLNMVTVAIAAMSLGVGIDYVIHVVERYREERSKGRSVHTSLVAMGGASGLALVGSAVSDVTGFAIISLSPMGFFSAFGLFCAIMIALSFIASMIIASGVLGIFGWRDVRQEVHEAGGIRKLQMNAEKHLGIWEGA